VPRALSDPGLRPGHERLVVPILLVSVSKGGPAGSSV
jgi:hypothetical protein